MLDSIFIGMSGLTGYSKGLRVIGNNLTNVNTPGYKSSTLEFADLFYQGSTKPGQGFSGSNQTGAQLGTGLNTLGTSISFKAGEMQQTGNSLDLAVNGDGYFILKDGDKLRYTKSGQFEFNKDGLLVSKTNGLQVMGFNDNGSLASISLNGLHSSAAKATTNVKFTGNISSNAAADVILNGVKVIDPVGGEHLVKLTFKNNSATTPGNWTVTASDSTGNIGNGTIQFNNGTIVAGSDKLSFTYAPAGVSSFVFTVDFSSDVTSFAAGNTSTIAVSSQDGYASGTLNNVTFDADGKLALTYSNGQSVKGMRLALAQFLVEHDIVQLGGNEFESTNSSSVKIGVANTQGFGTLSAGVIEGSNVDMAQEFSNLIVMQRGYQASSHVVSTANDMIQELFDMKGHR
ncbi:MAG: flagellar basal-body rod protein FlgF [Burkholderiales bacterium]|nr:flagellar basal-body rod protein FlgF [Burkholderiales bacterium]